MGIRTCFISGLALVLIPMTTIAKPQETKSSIRPDIQEHTLENGLRIYTLEDHSAPLATYEVWFQVGSGEERERPEDKDHGITGLSHFFEHMMFRGTEAHPKFFDAVYALGGKLNAWTWLDSTVYWEKIPSRHLGTIIECEADRLENMQMDFLALEPEREVVKSERLLRTENTAYGAISEVLDATAFQSHAYHWPTVGWMRDLNAITLEEARAHHAAYYVPNNAVIVVVGAFNTEQVVAKITEEYGHLKAKELPPSERGLEPEQEQERRDYVLKEVEANQAQMGYKVPGLSHPDFPALEVLDQVLNGGKSSRLKQTLIHGDVPRVSQLSSSLLPIKDPYLYIWNVKMLPGHPLEGAITSISEELENMAKENVLAEELETAVNRLQASVIREMLNNQQRADMIGFGILTAGDPYLFFDRLSLYQEVSVDDLKRVAAKYLVPERRTIISALAPERITTLAETWQKTQETGELGSLLTQAIELSFKLQDNAKKEFEAERERTAIRLLQERAVVAKEEAADAAEKAAIEAYMKENEKGDVTRTRNVEEESRRLREELEQLKAEQSALRNTLKGMSRQEKKSEIWNLAGLYAEMGSEGLVERLEKENISSAGGILLALWQEANGQYAKAKKHRSRVLGSTTESDLETMARSIAFDSLRENVLPREQTVGGQ